MALPLLDRLKESRRDDHTGLIEAIRDAVKSEPGLTSLQAAVQSDDRLIRRAAYLVALSADDAAADTFIAPALACDDIRVRMAASRRVMVEPRLAGWTETLRHSRVPSLRRLFLDRAVASSDFGELWTFLLDSNSGLRSAAQFYFRGEKAVEVTALYREALGASTDTVVATALLGLGEMKSVPDRDRVLTFLGHPKWRIRAAALAATDRLMGGDAVPALLDALSDPSARVAKIALAALQLRPAALSSKELLDIFARADDVRVKRHAVQLMAGLPRWTALACLLYCTADANAAGALALTLTDVWIRHANRSFVSPDAETALRIRQGLARASDVLGDRASEIASVLETWTPSR